MIVTSLRRLMIVATVVPLMTFESHALSFAEAYEAARVHDAQYRAAGHDLDASRQSVPVARSALMPSVALSMSGADVSGSRAFPNAVNQEVRVRVDYSTPQANLALRVPVFNHEARSRLSQAEAQADMAESVFRSRGLELIDRLAVGYLQVLLADEAKRLADVQVQALTSQLAQAQQRLQRGEGTRVDVAQTQAALDVSRVRVVEADDQLDLTRRQLRRITGLPTPPSRQVPGDYMPAPLPPEGLHQWLSLAVSQSPTLQARQQALTAARMGVSRQYAGHLPRLDLVASLSRSQNESLSNLNQTSVLRSIGMQLNVPLYSGGGVEASVKQAMAEQARAEEDVRAEREALEVEVQRHYQAVASGPSRITAYSRAVESAELALQGARRALEAGVGTNNDVSETLARRFSAARDLAQARIDYLTSRLRLMLQAGMPMSEVATDIDRALTVVTGSTPPMK